MAERTGSRGAARYLLRQLLGPFAFFALVLTLVVWLTQSLRLLDLILRKNQPAAIYAEFVLLAVPSVLAVVLPPAFFCAALYVLARLRNERELVVLCAAGLSRRRLADPILRAAIVLAALLALIHLWLAPASVARMRAQVYEIRADIAATLLREGEFRAPIRGLTVYVRARHGREVLGLLVHDNRDPDHPVTYLAAQGALLRGASGPVLLMREGIIQRVTDRPGRLAVLRFSRYSYDLSPFLPEAGPHKKKSAERSLAELFHPEAAVDADDRREFRAEGHGRLAAPLYAPAFGLIAAAALLSGPLGRPAGAVRVGIAAAAALGARLLGLIIVHLSARLPALIPLIHAVPLLTIAGCLVLLGERGPGRRVRALPRRAA